MGLLLQRMQESSCLQEDDDKTSTGLVKFPDLASLPPEISLLVLSYLDATDLCLAACVWNRLGNDEVLWRRFVSP